MDKVFAGGISDISQALMKGDEDATIITHEVKT
jgi:hypothetical protein